jgi:DNA (cytosine-5)-methyltransferase 1
MSKKYNGLSLFSSAGIGETYIEPYVNMVVSNELLIERTRLYSHFYNNSHVIHGDITDKNIFDNIIKESLLRNVDFIYATPPCQSFSKAGKQEKNDTRDILFLTIIKAIKELLPKYIIIENVPEFLKLYCNIDNEDKMVIDVFKNELELEYNICHDILDTSMFGIPQTRKRAIILLSKKTEKKWTFPEQRVEDKQIITVRETIGHLPSLESGDKSNVHKWHKAKIHNDRHILWMKNTPSGKTAFNNEIHYPSINGIKIKGYSTTYKRISWDKPCPTITMANGSISSQNNVHPGRLQIDNTYSDARVLTVYELILLTGLPPNWDIPEWCSENIIRQVLGECVPPKLILELVKNIGKIETNEIETNEIETNEIETNEIETNEIETNEDTKCNYIFKKGKNKGLQCSVLPKNGDFCSKHKNI